MASAFTHSFVALTGGKIAFAERMPVGFWITGIVCALLPDIDVIGFYLGIHYRDTFGHRGFTHSLLFAALVSLLAMLVVFRKEPRFTRTWWSLTAYFFLVSASHGVLDAMTSGGTGIAFFSPFVKTRYFLPWRPLVVSPIGVYGFFSRWGWRVIRSELLWIWLPMISLLAAATLRRRMHQSSRS
ncbi:MAG: metal-dependent hydrolase [Nitrospiraceae bacterium]|nr:metal-dependent hydrolase [Nitrospiraceae bacterium]